MKKQSFYNAQSAGEGNGILLLRLEVLFRMLQFSKCVLIPLI